MNLMNLVLNFLIFGLPLILGLYFLTKKSAKKKMERERYRIYNLLEDWKYYDLYMEVEEVCVKYKTTNDGICGLIVTDFLSKFYQVDINIEEEYEEDLAKSDVKKEAGISRKKILLVLKSYFILTSLDMKPKKDKDKGKGKITIESYLKQAEDAEEILIFIEPGHIGLITSANGNKFIDIVTKKEYIFDKDLHKIMLVSIKEELEDEDIE